MPSSPTFFTRLVDIARFYDQIIKVPMDKHPGRNLRYSGIVLVEREQQDVEDIIAVHLAGSTHPTAPVYRFVPALLHEGKMGNEHAVPETIEFLKVNAPILVVASDDGSESFRQFSNDIAINGFLDDKIASVLLVESIESTDKKIKARADFIFSIIHPTFDERVFYLKYLLGSDRGIDHGIIVKEMEGWTWDDIEKFCKHIAFHQQAIGVDGLSTSFLLDLLHGNDDRDPFMPPSRASKGKPVGSRDTPPAKEASSTPRVVVPSSFHDPFKEQLWQVAASTDHDVLSSMLDRLERGTITPEDQRLLSRYPFMLEEDPVVARKLLDAAKNKVDLLAKTFKTKGQ